MDANLDVLAPLLAALRFAAEKHRSQKRKGTDASPYINHPIEVAELLARVGGVRDVELLAAAILHDTIEDTETTPDELEAAFGARVCCLVAEVTDDKSLPKAERKKLQEEHAPQLSRDAKQLKLGDKISNVREIGAAPPADWSLERRREYIAWARSVVDGCRGANAALERHFDSIAAETEAALIRT
ncbi:MAG: HD domain-containing protein [Myxococcota bacterium]